MLNFQNDPYCGPAPLPEDLLSRWNLDPLLMIVMVGAALFHLHSLRQNGEFHRKRAPFAAVWLALAALFVSPLCALSSALFSARAGHHVALIALVAPIFVLSLPARWRFATASGGALMTLVLVHTAIVWIWHAPAPYVAALSNDALFWIMQVSLLASAVALWLVLLSPTTPLISSLGGLIASTIQMGLLGALITFAKQPLYTPHFGSTEAFGLSALADQQLAGLIMWVPAALPYLGAALALGGARLARATAAGRHT